MNNRSNRLRNFGLAVGIASLVTVFSFAQQAPEGASGPIVQGVTKPFIHSRPSFGGLGTVLELPVKEGQVVKKGDVLMKQDDRQEQAELQKVELEANSTVRIDAADADLKIQQVRLKRLLDLQKTGSAHPFEVEEAQSKVIYGEAQTKIARLEVDKYKRDADRMRAKIDQMVIKSPVDGRVQAIDAQIGDVTDPQRPVMSIVQNDPLKVEFFLPVAQAQKLKLGQPVQVRYVGEEQWMAATVAFKDPLADAASDTQKIGLEMKNADDRDSGLQVQVQLPPELAPATPAAANAGR
jgi:RND family efflux transporter MFP subunit